ncbi:hypothetical protein NOCA1280001 [metagenome]|uniref:ATP-binding protein n=1 Tax=metagenome TaxID=256318 RepID=A0A2P2CIA6_9ZZZZ
MGNPYRCGLVASTNHPWGCEGVLGPACPARGSGAERTIPSAASELDVALASTRGNTHIPAGAAASRCRQPATFAASAHADERVRLQTVLVQLSGVPGSGKSTLARSVAGANGFVVVDTDVLKSSIIDSGVPITAAGRVTYAAALALAQDLLEQGRGVLLDSPCRYQELADLGRQIAHAHGVRYAFIELWVQDWAAVLARLSAANQNLSAALRYLSPHQ